MRLKSIALLVVAMLLVVGPVAAIAVAGAEDRSSDKGWRIDARYWWEVWWGEDAPLTPYQRKQIGEITAMILDRYFGIEDSFVMSPDEFEKATRPLVGHEKEWEVLRLFGYYAKKRGFEVPAGIFDAPPGFETPLGIPVVIEAHPQDPQEYIPEPYWWEITCPQGGMKAIIYLVAQAKGKGMCRSEVEEMCPSEVEERFDELFPGVELWNMTFDEYILFLNSLPRAPRPPLRPVCFEELKGNPRIIALFGRVPPLSSEEEIEKFNEKLNEVIEAASPLLGKLPRCEFPLEGMLAHRGAISISVRSDQLPQAEVVYKILAEKAESLFGIKDVPVTFNNAMDDGRDVDHQAPLPGPASSGGWRPPRNEPFPRIHGGVKVTPRHRPYAYSTVSFTVRRRILLWDDVDYIITGHKGPPVAIPGVTLRPTITPVNMHIYQPIAPHEAGRVVANVGTRSHADAARVGISDARVHPYILIGGTKSNPALRPVFASGDPTRVGDVIWISAGRTGLTWQVEVKRMGVNIPHWPPFDMNYNQVLVRPLPGNPLTMAGDSGSPLWLSIWDPGRRQHGAKIHGLHVGRRTINGTLYMVMTPVSGVKREFPGWRVWYR